MDLKSDAALDEEETWSSTNGAPGSYDGLSPLAEAVKAGRLDIVSALLAARADPEVVYPGPEHRLYREPCLFLATRSGHARIADLLLHAHAGVNTFAGDGRTPLMAAASAGHPGVVSVLLRHKADIRAFARENQRGGPRGSEVGLCAFHLAVLGGHSDVVRLLLRTGQDPDQLAESGGTTALHLAAARPPGSGSGMVELLLASGADPLRPDVDGVTPLDHSLLFLDGDPENSRRREQAVLMMQRLSLNAASP